MRVRAASSLFAAFFHRSKKKESEITQIQQNPRCFLSTFVLFHGSKTAMLPLDYSSTPSCRPPQLCIFHFYKTTTSLYPLPPLVPSLVSLHSPPSRIPFLPWDFRDFFLARFLVGACEAGEGKAAQPKLRSLSAGFLSSLSLSSPSASFVLRC